MPWSSPVLEAEDTELMYLPAEVTTALGRGDLEAARAISVTALTSYLVSPECRAVWQAESRHVGGASSDTPWTARLIVDFGVERTVGWAGFCGPPDSTGTVDIGFAVDPAHRRKGYGRAALIILLERAELLPEVCTARVSVSVDDTPCHHLVTGYGFMVADGQEHQERQVVVFERAVQHSGPRSLPEGRSDNATMDLMGDTSAAPRRNNRPKAPTPSAAVPFLRLRVRAFIRKLTNR